MKNLWRMSIHELIKQARINKGWSMERLALEINAVEGKKKPLAWQTIQQWENGNSAPKRLRLATVAQVLGVDFSSGTLIAATPEASTAVVAMSPVPSYGPPPVPQQPTLYSIVLSLGAAIAGADAAARQAVGGLLQHMCLHPEQAELTARRIVAVMGVPGNEVPPRSIVSPTTAG